MDKTIIGKSEHLKCDYEVDDDHIIVKNDDDKYKSDYGNICENINENSGYENRKMNTMVKSYMKLVMNI